MVEFYRDVLGLTEEMTAETGGGWRVFSAGRMQLALHEKGVIEVHQSFIDPDAPIVRCDFLDPEGNVFQISSE